MKQIPLYRNGEVVAHAVVDDEDHGWLMRWRWAVTHRHDRAGKGTIYAKRAYIKSGKAVIVMMHAEILGNSDKENVFSDHINGDGLDNRRCNLRNCTASQNSCNRERWRKSKTGFRGVYKNQAGFYAAIRIKGKFVYLGFSKSPRSAHRLYMQRAKKEHGEFFHA